METKSMWYSNVLFELFQVVIMTSQRSEKCLRKFYLSKQFVLKRYLAVTTCNSSNPFCRTFSSKLLGRRGRGEPGHSL